MKYGPLRFARTLTPVSERQIDYASAFEAPPAIVRRGNIATRILYILLILFVFAVIALLFRNNP